MVSGDYGNTITIKGICYPLQEGYNFHTFTDNRYNIGNDEYIPIVKSVLRDSEYDEILSVNRELTEEEGLDIVKKYGFKERIHATTDELCLAWLYGTVSYALTLSWATPKTAYGDMWGDDWNDRPYECNAGDVYGEFVELTDSVILNPGWVFESLENYGTYRSGKLEYYLSGYQYHHSHVSVQDMLEDESKVFGRIVNMRTGESVDIKLKYTTRNELYKELKEKGAIN